MKFIVSIILLSVCLQVNATIRYVSKTGLSIPPYTSWETAADSIQECINVCVFGDTIYVANGVYEEQVVMIPGLSLIGEGPDSTIINTQALVTSTGFVTVEVKDSCIFKGFQIIVYYNSDKGYAIVGSGNSVITLNRIMNAGLGTYIGPNPMVYNNIYISVGRGIYLFNSNSLVRGNIINSNYFQGFGINLEAFNTSYTPVVDSNYITTIYIGIQVSFGTKPTITNNTIILRGNYAKGFFGSYTDTAKIFNNLFIAENAETGIISSTSTHLILNNYLTNNFSEDGMVIQAVNNKVENNVVTNGYRGIRTGNNPTSIFKYNNSWNNEVNYAGFTPDSTNLSVNPMIVNDDTTQGDLDFHLQMYSPLIDAGDPTILDKDSSRSDIGLYGGHFGESYVYLDLPPRPPVNLSAIVDSSIITLSWNKNTEADFSHYNLYRDTVINFTIDSTKLVASITDSFYLHLIPAKTESLYFKLTAVDNQNNESNPSEEVSVILVSAKGEWQTVNNYMLYQNYPNPFNPSTRIGYRLKERGYVKLYVYDIKGELVSVLVNQTQEAGYYEVEFDASAGNSHSGLPSGEVRNLASGIYIYQIMIRNEIDPSKPGPNGIPVFSDIKKMIYIK